VYTPDCDEYKYEDEDYNDFEDIHISAEQPETEDKVIEEVVYEDTNIKVSYCGIKEDTFELTYLFKIENNSSKSINVTFDNLYINGQRVYVSGLTCEKLLPGTSEVEDFVLKEFECNQNPEKENELVFTIKLMNAKSYLDIYETEQVTVVI
jgi:LEA14-like dessication related protein